MVDVSIRELRNNGRVVMERVEAGERFVVTRSGRPVAELRPLRRRGPSPEALLERWRGLPAADAGAVQRDLDEIVDSSL